MSGQFYATHDDPYGEVAVFSSQEQRDDWVNYKDPFSLLYPGNYDGKRIAITQAQAEKIAGNRLYNKEFYMEDFEFGNYFWVESDRPVPDAMDMINAIFLNEL